MSDQFSDPDVGRMCEQCGDPFDPHALLTTSDDGDPMKGGIMLCPVPGCQCFSTWSPRFSEEDEKVMPFVPDRARIEELRELVQRGEGAT